MFNILRFAMWSIWVNCLFFFEIQLLSFCPSLTLYVEYLRNLPSCIFLQALMSWCKVSSDLEQQSKELNIPLSVLSMTKGLFCDYICGISQSKSISK